MSKLTPEDIRTVETYFASPVGVRFTSDLAAQSYEPRGTGYQPTTDTRLARLVLAGVRPGKSAWALASNVIDQLCGRPGGGAHLEVLHRACSQTFGRPSVGSYTPRAMAYGRELAKDAARTAKLEDLYRDCMYRGRSTYDTTARVLDLDTKLRSRPIEVSDGAARMHAFDAIVDGSINVEAEIDALIDAAADALHAARERVREAERAAKAQKEQRGADLRAELADKKATKERCRSTKAKRVAELLADCVRLRAAS